MIEKQKGMTLVEVLTALTISSIVLVVIYNVFLSGLKASETASTNQSLQQEANIVLQIIKNHYLQSSSFEMVIEENEHLQTESLIVNGEIASEGYSYTFVTIDSSGEEVERKGSLKIDRTPFKLHLRIKNGEQSYDIQTTLTKLK